MRHSMPCSLTPRVVPRLRGVVQVAGEDLRCARLTNGQVKCWGSINEERTAKGIRITLCDPEKPCDPPPPTTIAGLPPIQQMAVNAAGLGVDRDGNVWEWGHRDAIEKRFTAERLSEFSDVARIRTADDATGCASYKSGSVACWKPSISQRHFVGHQEAPLKQLVPIPNLSDVVDIGTARDMACALRRDNSVWCWGSSAQALCSESGQGAETPCRVLPRIATEQ